MTSGMNSPRAPEFELAGRASGTAANGGPGRAQFLVNNGSGRQPVLLGRQTRVRRGPVPPRPAGPSLPLPEQPDPPSINVIVADREALLRAGIRSLLQSAAGIEVTGEARDAVSARELLGCDGAHVAVVGIGDADPAILQLIEWIRDNVVGCEIVALVTRPIPETVVYRILRGGARALVDRAASSAELVEAVRAVTVGDAVLSPWLTRRLVERLVRVDVERSERAAALIGALTEREREVLAQVAQGTGNAEIARKLYMSESTVKANISKTLIKLNCQNRVQAACLAQSAELAE